MVFRIVFVLRIRLSEEYEISTNYVLNSSEVKEKIGNDISFGFFPSGRIKTINSKNYAAIKLKVFGSKTEKTLIVYISQNDFYKWELDDIEYFD